MAEMANNAAEYTQNKATDTRSSYSHVIQRMNEIAANYSNLPTSSIYAAFGRATQSWANMAPLQNSRLKAIGTLPADYDKHSLGEFLRTPQNYEKPLRQISEGLKWSTYSFYKLQKSYSDMLTFKHYIIPQYVTADEIKTESFRREFKLVDKLLKAIDIKSFGHKVAGEALVNGKAFYVPRYSIDKSHNKINYFFLQRLPQNWVVLEGLNNISNYTISFDLNYFLQPGTDYRQFGDLFEPYMRDFFTWVEADKQKTVNGKYVYASHNNVKIESKIKAWEQNGRWFYYVSLPIDKIWTFEIDDTTPIVVSPLSGLLQTFAQQADYEAAQLSLILNPLIKIFTGEIPYTKADNSTQEDAFRLSIGGRALFEAYWDNLMACHNTGGTAFFSAPVENLRSHDFPESANANSVSQSFLTYGLEKSGTTGIVPITDRPTEEAIRTSTKLEARYSQCIYRALENMINNIFNEQLNLTYSWKCVVFGDIYNDEQIRANCLKQIDKGDITAWAILCALEDMSILDKVALGEVVASSGFLELLQPPQLSYTQSGKTLPKSDTNGAPTKTDTDRIETQIEKQGVPRQNE